MPPSGTHTLPVWVTGVRSMLRHIAGRASDGVARAQLLLLNRLGDAVHLSADDCGRALDLSDFEWQAWRDFRDQHRPLPPRPALADMLQRVARISFNLVIVTEIRNCAHQ